MRAPAAGRSAAGNLPSAFSSSVSAPALPRYRALAFSSAAGSSHRSNSVRAWDTIVSSSFIGFAASEELRNQKSGGGLRLHTNFPS